MIQNVFGDGDGNDYDDDDGDDGFKRQYIKSLKWITTSTVGNHIDDNFMQIFGRMCKMVHFLKDRQKVLATATVAASS